MDDVGGIGNPALATKRHIMEHDICRFGRDSVRVKCILLEKLEDSGYITAARSSFLLDFVDIITPTGRRAASC